MLAYKIYIVKKIGIVGGGIIGLTTAFVLRKKFRSKRENVEIEIFEMGDSVGNKSTTAAGCGLRTVYDHPTNVELARKGINFWSNADSIVGGDVGFRRNGYVFLTDDENYSEEFRMLSSKQHSYGIPCSVEEPPQNQRGIKGLKTQNYMSALHSPTAALASPQKMVDRLEESFNESDVQIHLNEKVKDADNSGQGVVLETQDFSKRFDYVVNACGAWSQNIADMVNSDLPVRNAKRRLSVLDMRIDEDAPLTVDIDTGVYVLPSESGQAMVGGHILDSKDDVEIDEEAFSERQNPDWNRKFSTLSQEFSEDISSANIVDSWTGLYSITPSRIPIIDNDEGLIHATGFSGHGIMHAPGAAMIIARMVSEKESRLDMIASLNKEREVLDSDIQF